MEIKQELGVWLALSSNPFPEGKNSFRSQNSFNERIDEKTKVHSTDKSPRHWHSDHTSEASKPALVPRIDTRVIYFFFLFVRKIGPDLTSVANLPPFSSPPSPSTQLYILVVGHSSSPIWDPGTAWLDEWCIGLCPGSQPVNPKLPK